MNDLISNMKELEALPMVMNLIKLDFEFLKIVQSKEVSNG